MDAHYSVYNEGINGFYSFMDSVFQLPVQDDGFYNRMYDKAIGLYGRELAKNLRMSLLGRRRRLTAMIPILYMVHLMRLEI